MLLPVASISKAFYSELRKLQNLQIAPKTSKSIDEEDYELFLSVCFQRLLLQHLKRCFYLGPVIFRVESTPSPTSSSDGVSSQLLTSPPQKTGNLPLLSDFIEDEEEGKFLAKNPPFSRLLPRGMACGIAVGPFSLPSVDEEEEVFDGKLEEIYQRCIEWLNAGVKVIIFESPEVLSLLEKIKSPAGESVFLIPSSSPPLLPSATSPPPSTRTEASPSPPPSTHTDASPPPPSAIIPPPSPPSSSSHSTTTPQPSHSVDVVESYRKLLRLIEFCFRLPLHRVAIDITPEKSSVQAKKLSEAYKAYPPPERVEFLAQCLSLLRSLLGGASAIVIDPLVMLDLLDGEDMRVSSFLQARVGGEKPVKNDGSCLVQSSGGGGGGVCVLRSLPGASRVGDESSLNGAGGNISLAGVASPGVVASPTPLSLPTNSNSLNSSISPPPLAPPTSLSSCTFPSSPPTSAASPYSPSTTHSLNTPARSATASSVSEASPPPSRPSSPLSSLEAASTQYSGPEKLSELIKLGGVHIPPLSDAKHRKETPFFFQFCELLASEFSKSEDSIPRILLGAGTQVFPPSHNHELLDYAQKMLIFSLRADERFAGFSFSSLACSLNKLGVGFWCDSCKFFPQALSEGAAASDGEGRTPSSGVCEKQMDNRYEAANCCSGISNFGLYEAFFRGVVKGNEAFGGNEGGAGGRGGEGGPVSDGGGCSKGSNGNNITNQGTPLDEANHHDETNPPPCTKSHDSTTTTPPTTYPVQSPSQSSNSTINPMQPTRVSDCNMEGKLNGRITKTQDSHLVGASSAHSSSHMNLKLDAEKDASSGLEKSLLSSSSTSSSSTSSSSSSQAPQSSTAFCFKEEENPQISHITTILTLPAEETAKTSDTSPPSLLKESKTHTPQSILRKFELAFLSSSLIRSAPLQLLLMGVEVHFAWDVDTLECFASCISSDRPDGLFHTVVCDAHGVCLGLVYSSSLSLRASILEGRGIYQSRKRGLWRKGDTTGCVQSLIGLSLDCDSDALRFMVHQRYIPLELIAQYTSSANPPHTPQEDPSSAFSQFLLPLPSAVADAAALLAAPSFCHLERYTCWGPSRGVVGLEHILQCRKREAPEGSYTHKLLKNPQLIRAKLLEEVQELTEAEDHDHIATEAADVIFFLMTRCISAGVEWHEVERVLDERSQKVVRRPGLEKPERVAAAEKHLISK